MSWLNLLKLLLVPPTCVCCDAVGSTLCNRCLDNISLIDLPLCLICDNPCIDGIPHKVCSTPSAPNQLISPFEYAGIAKKIIIKSKYGPKSYKLLDTLIYHAHSATLIKRLHPIDIITPIPMAIEIFPKRTVNHAGYIANEIGKILRKPAIDLMKKKGGAKAQKRLFREQRGANITGQFLLKANKNLKGASILLVDDIATTGSTLIEASTTLKRAGAKNICCYTLAKDLRYN